MSSELLVDTQEAEKHLAALGIGPKDQVILCCYSKGGNMFVPPRSGERYDWLAVQEYIRRKGRDWASIRAYLRSNKNRSLGFISSPGGTKCTGHDPEIFCVTALVYEIDTLPVEDQWGLWELAGLPVPSAVLDTGNKSLHVWYRLANPVTVDVGRQARARLSAAIEAVRPGIQTDHQLHSPHQPTRLAGGLHPKTGIRSHLVLNSGNAYELDELLAVCPELPHETSRKFSGEVRRAAPRKFGQIIARSDLPIVREILLNVLQPADRFSDYDTWLMVGMVCNDLSQRAGDDEALLESWLQWSSQMENFDEKECLDKWQGCTATGISDRNLKVATLIKFVKDKVDPAWTQTTSLQRIHQRHNHV